ncbi:MULTISPECIES: hypothetical protein [Amycolatopsis]|nr:hypothetical protein [Amycolatopsis bullii]
MTQKRRLSKGSAVGTAVIFVGAIIAVLIKFPLNEPFVWVWLGVAALVVPFVLWVAFSKRGAKIPVKEGPPPGP